MTTTYKVVNVNTGKVIKNNLDFYAGRYLMGDRDDVTMMESDANITERLERRQKLIKLQEAEEL